MYLSALSTLLVDACAIKTSIVGFYGACCRCQHFLVFVRTATEKNMLQVTFVSLLKCVIEQNRKSKTIYTIDKNDDSRYVINDLLIDKKS